MPWLEASASYVHTKRDGLETFRQNPFKDDKELAEIIAWISFASKKDPQSDGL